MRDAFLDRGDGPDVDIATDARPETVAELVLPWADAVWTQGQRFGTIGCEKNGETFEITTFRADVYRPESRKPHVTYADDIETDLSRRDFTVNAMALDLEPGLEEPFVDPYGGLADLAAHRLRTPLGPEISFGDDPLRMLRAARFVGVLGFEPDPAMVEAIGAMRERLSIISAERIRDELSKLLLADDPSAGLWLALAHRALGRVPARAQRHAARTGSDPPSQGCARAHDRGGGQDAARAEGTPRRVAARRRQAEDARATATTA